MSNHPKTLILTGLILLVGIPLIYRLWPRAVPIPPLDLSDSVKGQFFIGEPLLCNSPIDSKPSTPEVLHLHYDPRYGYPCTFNLQDLNGRNVDCTPLEPTQ
jgi:hypothetical protein